MRLPWRATAARPLQRARVVSAERQRTDDGNEAERSDEFVQSRGPEGDMRETPDSDSQRALTEDTQP